MYNQTFSPHELAGCLKQTELRNFGSTRDKMEEQITACVGDRLYDGTYTKNIYATKLQISTRRDDHLT